MSDQRIVRYQVVLMESPGLTITPCEVIVLGVLTQRLGSEPQPVAYLSKRLDPTNRGWPPAFEILQLLQS